MIGGLGKIGILGIELSFGEKFEWIGNIFMRNILWKKFGIERLIERVEGINERG